MAPTSKPRRPHSPRRSTREYTREVLHRLVDFFGFDPDADHKPELSEGGHSLAPSPEPASPEPHSPEPASPDSASPDSASKDTA